MRHAIGEHSCNVISHHQSILRIRQPAQQHRTRQRDGRIPRRARHSPTKRNPQSAGTSTPCNCSADSSSSAAATCAAAPEVAGSIPISRNKMVHRARNVIDRDSRHRAPIHPIRGSAVHKIIRRAPRTKPAIFPNYPNRSRAIHRRRRQRPAANPSRIGVKLNVEIVTGALQLAPPSLEL